MSTGSAPRRRIWVQIDWAAPGPAITIVGEFVRAARPHDPVELGLATGSLSEADTAARLVAGLNELPGFAPRGPQLPEVAVHEGPVPPDAEVLGTATAQAVTESRRRLHELRRELATIAAVTPVLDRAEWARTWLTEPGFHHLVVDNASTDGTPALAAAAGAEVVVQPATVGRVANWVSAMHHFAQRTSLPWLKWLFAGDELLPGAADLLDAAAAEHPQARLIVAEYLIRAADGTTTHWRQLPETRLVMPGESLERSARNGNWFGAPIAQAFHRDVLGEVEFGSQPWVADWQAALCIARSHPVLYIAEPIGIFDLSSRRFFESQELTVHSLVQELSLRQQSVQALVDRAPDDPAIRQLELEVDGHAAETLAARVRDRLTQVAVGDGRRAPAGVSERGGSAVSERGGTAVSGPVFAVHAPRIADRSGRDIMGYAPQFAATYATYAYMPELDGHHEVRRRRAAGEPVVGANGLEVVTNAAELNQVADVLVCFEGRAYLPEMAPPREFTGLKAYHAWEFVFYAPETNRAMVDGGVDVVLGYCRHDEYSPFFRAMFPTFTGRTIGVPFGFQPRFAPLVPFGERTPKVIGLGSVNPVDDPLCPPGELDAYVAFHAGERWTHRWRRTLLEHADELSDVLDARFPVFPETKDFSYDAVEVLNAYAMFANDPGIMAFPPARTYEGVACGALLVGEDTAVHRDLGFTHGENALLHVPDDTEDFARVVREAIAEPERLAEMAEAGQRMVHERYTHPAVARTLYEQLCRVFAGRGS